MGTHHQAGNADHCQYQLDEVPDQADCSGSGFTSGTEVVSEYSAEREGTDDGEEEGHDILAGIKLEQAVPPGIARKFE